MLPAPPSSTVTTRVAVLSSSSRSWLMKRIVLFGLADPLLEPDLARHVEEVVRLVEEQHLVGAAQQELQDQPLLLTARQGGQLAVLHLVVGHPQTSDRADIPRHLDVVPTGIGELRERVRVSHLRLLVVGLHQRQLPPVDRGRGAADARWRDGEQQVRDRRRLTEPGPDHLPHHAQPTGAGHRAGVGSQVAGDDPQQRGLAGAVGTDQRDLGALTHPERDVVEQHPTIGQLVADSGNIDMTHVERFSGIGARHRELITPRHRLRESRQTRATIRPRLGARGEDRFTVKGIIFNVVEDAISTQHGDCHLGSAAGDGRAAGGLHLAG